MKKALLIIDLQEDYIGDNRNKKRFCYKNDHELIRLTNDVIAKNSESNNLIVYIQHIFPKNFFFTTLMKLNHPEFVKTLTICSEFIFTKSKASAFTNKALLDLLTQEGIKEISICGIDEGGCVAATAWEARKLGFEVQILKNCVDSVFVHRASKYRVKLQKAGVLYQ